MRQQGRAPAASGSPGNGGGFRWWGQRCSNERPLAPRQADWTAPVPMDLPPGVVFAVPPEAASTHPHSNCMAAPVALRQVRLAASDSASDDQQQPDLHSGRACQRSWLNCLRVDVARTGAAGPRRPGPRAGCPGEVGWRMWRAVGGAPGSRSPDGVESAWLRRASAGGLRGGGASSRGDSRPWEESSMVPGRSEFWPGTGPVACLPTR